MSQEYDETPNETERLDGIFGYYYEKVAYPTPISSLWSSRLKWRPNQQEMNHTENMLIMSKMFYVQQNGIVKTLDLTPEAKEVLRRFGTYSACKTSLEEKETERYKENQEEKNATAEIRKLTAEVLAIQVGNKEKDNALKDMQTKLASLHLEDYPETRRLAGAADAIGRKSLRVAVWSMVIALLALATTVILELLKHYKVWPFE